VCGPTDSLCNTFWGGANNRASSDNSYDAGAVGGSAGLSLRDWFEFSIPSISPGETLEGATLELYDNVHYGGTFTFSVYGLSSQPPQASDITGALLGSVDTSSADKGALLNISLNAAGLAAIEAAQGGSLFLGGIDPGETVHGFTAQGDFIGSGSGDLTSLSLVLQPAVSPIPEPAFALPLLGAMGLLFAVRAGKRRQA
jgi:hypothetical protein